MRLLISQNQIVFKKEGEADMTDEKTINNEDIQHLGTEILKTFRMTIANFKIYPMGSNILDSSINSLLLLIKTGLHTYPELIISQANEKLLFQGKELPLSAELSKAALDNFWKILAEHNIQSITFEPGIEQKELIVLIEHLVSKKEHKDELIELFNEKENSHISLDQTVYVPILKGEIVIQKVSNSLSHIKKGEEIESVLKTLSQTYGMMEQIPEQNVKNNIQKHLATKLADLNPMVLKEIFERQLPQKIEQSGLKDTLFSTLSKEKITEIFSEITCWYKDLSNQDNPNFKSIDQLNSLKTFISKVLTSPTSKKVSFKVFEQLLKNELIDKIPEGVKEIKDEKKELLFNTDELLEKESASLLESPVYQEIPLMIKQLSQLNLNDYAQDLTKKVLENMEHTSPMIRLSAIQLIIKISEALSLIKNEKLLNIIQGKIFEYLEKETSLEVYKHITQFLITRANYFLLKKDTDTLFLIIKALKKSQLFSQEKEKTTLINISLEKIAYESKEILLNDLKSISPQKHETCLRIISTLGNSCTKFLIESIREIEDLRIRKNVAKALKNTGNEGINLLRDELNFGLSSSSLKKIIEILDEFKIEPFLRELELLSAFPDPSIKKDIIHLIAKTNNVQTSNILMKFLNDSDLSVQQETIKELGKTKSIESVDKLIRLFKKSDNIPFQEEICFALGKIGSEKTFPFLIKLLKKRKKILGLGKGTDECLRLRIAWSLRNFPGDKTKKVLLKTIKKDKSKLVQKIANESLDVLEKKNISPNKS